MKIGASLQCFECGATTYYELTELYHALDVEIWADEHNHKGGKPVSRIDPNLPTLTATLQEPT